MYFASLFFFLRMNFIQKNIFANLPDTSRDEIIEEIISSENCRIERIISEGQHSPKNFWYEQDENEFVILLQGSAVIEFDDGKTINLKVGDYIYLPAKMRHRVKSTDNKIKTIWLAVFFSDLY